MDYTIIWNIFWALINSQSSLIAIISAILSINTVIAFIKFLIF